MVLQAARAISDGFRALGEFGAHAVAHLRRIPIVAVLMFALALGWLGTAGWWNYVRPQEFGSRAYELYQEEVAMCRALRTSEARYDCVAKALISRDHANFGTAIFVFGPAIVLVFGYYLWREIRSNMLEREHARRAEEKGRQHMSKFRQEMLTERTSTRPGKVIEAEARSRRTYDPRPMRVATPDHHAIKGTPSERTPKQA